VTEKPDFSSLTFLPFLVNVTPPCAESDPDAFFPMEAESGEGVGRRYENERGAKAVCAECPVRIDCLQYALENNTAGIWGGLTERERRRLRKSKTR
jgi:WhiB family redox-sensing transcriptional regulator